MYDRRVQHDGYLNTYSFMKDEHKIILRPLHPGELSKRHESMQVELMELLATLTKANLSLFPHPRRSPRRRITCL